MNFPDAESLTQSYATNHWLIGVLIEGLTHDDKRTTTAWCSPLMKEIASTGCWVTYFPAATLQ